MHFELTAGKEVISDARMIFINSEEITVVGGLIVSEGRDLTLTNRFALRT